MGLTPFDHGTIFRPLYQQVARIHGKSGFPRILRVAFRTMFAEHGHNLMGEINFSRANTSKCEEKEYKARESHFDAKDDGERFSAGSLSNITRDSFVAIQRSGK